jgi:RNA polymerase sigma-70 factor (ECF subfamily)
MATHAEDLVQEVMVRLLGYLRRDEGNRTFSSIYLEKAAHGALVDEIRRRQRRREDPAGDPAVLESQPAGQADPEGSAAGREVGRGIRGCLAELAVPRRLAVVLYLQGCTVPEAARRLGWSAKRTENLVYRGLAGVRDCLRRKGLEP